jgi:hypothetical protein
MYVLNVISLLTKLVVADSPHTIGVEFGTQIITVRDKRIKLQVNKTAYANFLDCILNLFLFL